MVCCIWTASPLGNRLGLLRSPEHRAVATCVPLTGKPVVVRKMRSGRRLLERQLYYIHSRPDDQVASAIVHQLPFYKAGKTSHSLPVPASSNFCHGCGTILPLKYSNSISSLELSRSCLPRCTSHTKRKSRRLVRSWRPNLHGSNHSRSYPSGGRHQSLITMVGPLR